MLKWLWWKYIIYHHNIKGAKQKGNWLSLNQIKNVDFEQACVLKLHLCVLNLLICVFWHAVWGTVGDRFLKTDIIKLLNTQRLKSHSCMWILHWCVLESHSCVLKSYVSCKNRTMCVRITLVRVIIRLLHVSIPSCVWITLFVWKPHFVCINLIHACRSHTWVCKNHSHECVNYTRASWNHTLRVKITLFFVEMTLVRVIIRLSYVAIPLCVWITLFEWKLHSVCINLIRACHT
jgi:hypothetical protein